MDILRATKQYGPIHSTGSKPMCLGMKRLSIPQTCTIHAYQNYNCIKLKRKQVISIYEQYLLIVSLNKIDS